MKLLDSKADIKYQNFIIDTENPKATFKEKIPVFIQGILH